MGTPMKRGEELVGLLATPGLGRDEIGRAANELLSALFAGFPVTALVPLLRSENTEAVKAGAWLVSELGEGAAPVIGEIAALLAHPQAYVRHFALDAVITATTEADGELIAGGIRLVDDPNPGVREKVIRLLSVIPAARLAAALPHLIGDTGHELTTWLLREAEHPEEAAGATARLESADPAERRFAAALALRIADHNDEPLARAAEASDPDIASLAAFVLRRRDRRRRRSR
ncbi:MAG: hypothetical protein GEV11_07990 [Streptosporangiales bacterium]|nr:hypothetical protein [Streptosporangiales bacterium]